MSIVVRNISVLSLIGLVFLCGCQRRIWYAIEVKNASGADVDNVHLEFQDGSFSFSFGGLRSTGERGGASYNNVAVPLPESAVLSWETVERKIEKKEIAIPLRKLFAAEIDYYSRDNRVVINLQQNDEVHVYLKQDRGSMIRKTPVHVFNAKEGNPG